MGRRISRLSAVVAMVAILAQAGSAVAADPAVAPPPERNLGAQRIAPAGATPTGVAVGRTHACTIVSGEVRCMGDNDHGQLGDGTRIPSAIPVTVMNDNGTPLAPVSALAAGDDFTCALLVAGTVECWGSDAFGQMGPLAPGTAPRTHPVQIVSLLGVQRITAGHDHACALNGAGSVLCWGRNQQGQLGRGNTLDSPQAFPVLGVVASTIGAGDSHTCAVILVPVAGTVRCWGANSRSQLGNGGAVRSTVPVSVIGASAVVQVDGGAEHTCAVRSDGLAYCWGRNPDGRIGDGTTTNRSVPVFVRNSSGTAINNFTQIVAANSHTCALQGNGKERCWGGNALSQLGDNTTTRRLNPTLVDIISDGSRLAAGGATTCAI